MKHVAHIVSLPRCRTAWLSVALSQAPHSFAFHDGCGDGSRHAILTPRQYADKMLARPERCITDCSSGIPSLPAHLATFLGPIVVIEAADETRCRDSWVQHLKQPALMEAWPAVLANFHHCQERFGHRIALRVPFDQINEAMPAIWEVCCPGAPYDAGRIVELQRLAIQEIH